MLLFFYSNHLRYQKRLIEEQRMLDWGRRLEASEKRLLRDLEKVIEKQQADADFHEGRP